MRQAPQDLTAAEALGLMAARRLSATELVEALVGQIEATEADLHAWVSIDFEGSREAARMATGAPVLGAIPFGVKDVIDVAGAVTGCGFAPFTDRLAGTDAAAVARLRTAGAIVLGKTTTTQFAFRDPPDTLNPWDRTRSPGGSSTGSAVAVAARHVPFALGTQTSGSVLRPAAFNGVVGFKPSFGLISKKGVFPDAWSLDHVGVLARSVEDCALVLAAARSRPPAPSPRSAPLADRPVKLGLLRSAVEAASPDVAAHVLDAAARFQSAGATVVEVAIGHPLELVHAVHQVTMQTEMAAAHRELLESHPAAYRPGLRAFLEVGSVLPAWAYVHAQRIRRRIRDELGSTLLQVDALLLPTCTTLAPPRESGTGDSSLQAPFSLIGAPSISLPSPPAGGNLPHAIQLASAPGCDDTLLAVAAWCEARLDPVPAPPRQQVTP